MTYIKLFLTASLALLLAHCGKGDGVMAPGKISTKGLSPALQKVDCLSGVYQTSGDVNDGFWISAASTVSFWDEEDVQVSIAHNANNADSKAIVLVELVDKEEENTAVCSILSDIKSAEDEDNSVITAKVDGNTGALQSVKGVQGLIQFEELSGGTQGFGCEPTKNGFLTFVDEDGDEIGDTDNVVKLEKQAPSFKELEQKCAALGTAVAAS